MTNPYRGARPPERRGTWNVPRQQGLISDARQAWVTTPDFDAILFVDTQEDKGYAPDTPPVRIELRIPGRRNGTRISLTKMTEAELLEFKKFMDHAIDKARPICRLLDERALEAYNDGNDAHARLYRPVPEFFDRERFVREHDKGVQRRSARLVDSGEPEATGGVPRPEHAGSGSDPSGVHPNGDRASGGGLPDEEQGSVEPEHDEQEAGSTPEVREVDGVAGLPWEL